MYAVWKASKYYIFKIGSGWQNGFSKMSTLHSNGTAGSGSNEIFNSNTTMIYNEQFYVENEKFGFYANKAIDLTNYNYVVYENVYFKHYDVVAGWHELVIGVYKNNNGTLTAGKESWLSSTNTRDENNPQISGGTHKIDVRSLSGNYYVGGYVNSTNPDWTSIYTVRFYNIYLE